MAERGKGHWDEVYRRKAPDDVSWFQPSLTVSLEIIDGLALPPDAAIIDVGGGASTLVDDLLERGFADITVLDISPQALAVARERLGARGAGVSWLAADITKVELPRSRYQLWHDRAVFHFLTEPQQRRRYVEQAHAALAPGGHIVVSTFGEQGPEQCSGLDVVRYDPDGLHAEFGAPFRKVAARRERHQTPWGSEQEFVYCQCRHEG